MERLQIQETKLSRRSKEALEFWRSLEIPWSYTLSMLAFQKDQNDNFDIEIIIHSPLDGDSLCQIHVSQEVRLRWSQGFAFSVLNSESSLQDQMHVIVDVLSQLWLEQVILVKYREDDGPLKVKIVDIDSSKDYISVLRRDQITGSLEVYSFHGRWNTRFKMTA